MANLLAIVSKAEFEGAHKSAKLGDTLRVDRYVSTNKALTPLSEGGALFLVTVRPPDEALWLVAVLESPVHDGTMWRAPPNAVPTRDLSAIRDQLRFSTGAGIQAKKGALGMSLQTPRRLTDADVALLRGGAATAARPAPPPGEERARGAKRKPNTKPAPRPVAPPASGPRPPRGDASLPDYEEPAPVEWTDEMRRLWAEALADPDDLVARSVLADKLQELGDPWGEYLQLACRLATMSDEDAARGEVEGRAEQLLSRYQGPFTRAIRSVADFCPDGFLAPGIVGFARGCVERLRLQGDRTRALSSLARAAPIRDLIVEQGAPTPEPWESAFAAMPELARLRSLTLPCQDEVRALALLSSPHLTRVEALALSGSVTPAVLAAIAAGPAFAGLQELRLQGNHEQPGLGEEVATALAKLPIRRFSGSVLGLGAQGVRALASVWPLEDLELVSDPLGLAGARALAEAPLSKLTRLSLQMCDIQEKGCAAVAGARHMGALRELEISHGCGFNAKALDAMLANWALPALRRLRLHGPIREAGAARLAAAPWIRSVESLTISDGALKAEGARALARADAPSLRKLELHGCGLDEAAMRALAEGPLLAHVTSLDLARNKCGAEGGKALAKAPGLEKLEVLRLHYNWMGVGGARALLERMPSARELYLGENNYGSEPMRVAARGLLPRLRTMRLYTEGDGDSLTAWMKSGHARALRSLGLRQTRVSKEAAEALVRLPELRELSFTFCTFDAGVVGPLRERLPAGASFWPKVPE